MYKLLKVYLCVSIMMLAITAQPYGKDKDVRNKSSGTELVKADVCNFDLAVAPVVIDVPAIDYYFVASGSQDINYAVYITTQEAAKRLSSITKKPPKPERSYYLAQLTDFKVAALEWKDFHRRMRSV